MPDYYTLWTDAGLQKIGEATGNQPFSMPTAVVGDGNGKTIIPNKGMTALVNQVWSGQVGSVFRSQKDPNTRVYEFVIPASAGPFTIREVGLTDAGGNLCIVGNFPATEKPVKTSGTTRDMVIRIPAHFENADHVTLVVDPAAGASKGYVDQKVGEHADKRNNPHGVTKAQVGLGNLPNAKSDSVTSASSDQLATSKAVKAAFDKADAALPKTDQAADSARIGGVSAERVLCAETSSWATRLQNLNEIKKTGSYSALCESGNTILGGPVSVPGGGWIWAFKWQHAHNSNSKAGAMIAAENLPGSARFWLRSTGLDGCGDWTQIYTHRHPPDFKSRLGQNGYQKLPSGVLIQWGWDNSGDQAASVRFPISFPHECVYIGVTQTESNEGKFDTVLKKYNKSGATIEQVGADFVYFALGY